MFRHPILLWLVLCTCTSTAVAEFQLRWSRELPVRQTKWKYVRDMQKDTAYLPTAAGDLVFVGCSHNGALLALDAKTGEERWRYYTNGAIRTHAVADGKQVMFGSGDGFVYCLDHGGNLRWKAPVGQGQRFVIGHQRLTSAWPVPTHPVLHEGTLYVMGGCWPADGVFMNAFDVATGKLLWRSPSMAMRVMMIPLFVKEDHIYARTYSGTGGKAMRFELETGLASPWPKGTEYPRPERVDVPGAEDLVGSNESNGLRFGTGKDGRLFCAGPIQAAKPIHHLRQIDSASTDHATAKEVLAVTGKTEGYCLVTGLEDGSVVEGLLRNSQLHVVAVDADEAKVNRIRCELDARGCFDEHRLSMLSLELADDVLPPYFADLVLTEGLAEPSALAMQSLRPNFHTSGSKPARDQDFNGGLRALKNNDTMVSVAEPPMTAAGHWSHEYANAAMTNSTNDTLVKAPLGILWYGGPGGDRKYYLSGNRPTGALVVEGRMFLHGNGVIAAIDAYNGRLLWEAEIPEMHIYNGTHGGGGGGLRQSTPWNDEKAAAKGVPPIRHCRATGFNWAAASDCLYLLADDQCLRFDPATGQSLDPWPMPLTDNSEEPLCWGCPRIAGDILVATAFRPRDMHDARIGIGGNGGDWTGDRMPMSHVFAVNRKTGELLWSQHANFGFNNRAFIAAGGRVYCTDLLQTDAVEGYLINGRKIPDVPASVRAFDLETGQPVWHKHLERLVKYLTYIEKDDILLVPNRYGRTWTDKGWGRPGLSKRDTQKKSGRPNGVFRGFRGKTGEMLWEVNEMHYDGPFTVIGDRVLNRYGTAFDPQTGKLSMRQSPVTGQPESYGFKKSGCAVLGGCPNVVAWRTAYHDMSRGTSTKLPGFEAGCTTSLLPACGMLNMPNFGLFHLRARAAAVSLVHRPSAQPQTEFQLTRAGQPTTILRIGYNFGAIGDRYASDSTLWVRAARGGNFDINIQPKEHFSFNLGSGDEHRGELFWVGLSGVEGVTQIRVPTKLNQKDSRKISHYHVRLFFADPKRLPIGERIFDLAIEGETVLSDFDIAKSGGGLVVKRFQNLEIKGEVDIEFTAKEGQPLLNGIELIAVD